MIDLLELTEKAWNKDQALKEKQKNARIDQGINNFEPFKLKFQDRFLSDLDKFFGKRIDCEVVAFDSMSYNPLTYVDVDWIPSFMTVRCPENEKLHAFTLLVYKSNLKKGIYFYSNYETQLRSLAELYPFLRTRIKKPK